VEVDALPVRLGATPAEVNALLGAAHLTVQIGSRIYLGATIDACARRLVAMVDEYHQHFPLEPGAPLQSVRAQLGADGPVAELVLSDLVASSRLAVQGARVMRAGWAPVLSEAATATRGELLETLRAAGAEPPSVSDLQQRFGAVSIPLLRMLERDGEVVQVEAERYYAASALAGLVATLRANMRAERAYSPAELRDMLGLSRKFLIPILEYCDRNGITMRRGGERVIAVR
jgi:selenocysteine-specific elongation factor